MKIRLSDYVVTPMQLLTKFPSSIFASTAFDCRWERRVYQRSNRKKFTRIEMEKYSSIIRSRSRANMKQISPSFLLSSYIVHILIIRTEIREHDYIEDVKCPVGTIRH